MSFADDAFHAFHDFLSRYGQALATGDTAEVARCFALPAMVIRGGAGSVVTTRSELIRAFEGLSERYRDEGLWLPDPSITRLDLLSDQLASLDVTWIGYNQHGILNGHVERYSYLMHRDRSEWRIQVAADLTGTAVPVTVPDLPSPATVEFR